MVFYAPNSALVMIKDECLQMMRRPINPAPVPSRQAMANYFIGKGPNGEKKMFYDREEAQRSWSRNC